MRVSELTISFYCSVYEFTCKNKHSFSLQAGIHLLSGSHRQCSEPTSVTSPLTHSGKFLLVQLHGHLRSITSAMTNIVRSHSGSCALPCLMRSRHDGLLEQNSSSARVCLRQRHVELDVDPGKMIATSLPPHPNEGSTVTGLQRVEGGEPESSSGFFGSLLHRLRNQQRSRHGDYFNLTGQDRADLQFYQGELVSYHSLLC